MLNALRTAAAVLVAFWAWDVDCLNIISVEDLQPTYDFVIVGGGTAGMAVATRLSLGLPKLSVLVIEAGPVALNEPKINIPGLRGSTFGGPYDWNYTTTPQAGMNGRQVAVTRGKVLGGSSALNLMVWDRAAAAEYDMWQQLGDGGWNWTYMYENMLKVENFTRSDKYGKKGVGYGGPIQTMIDPWRPRHLSSYIPSMEHLGIGHNRESLDGDPIGVADQPSNIRSSNITRSFSAVGYAVPLAGPNLSILPNTTVKKLHVFIMGTSTAEVSQVELADGTTIHVNKEVVLSAGTIGSPGILERSGFGNPDYLTSVGVQWMVNLPGVGENLQDHLRVFLNYQLKDGYTSVDKLKYNATYAAEQMQLYNEGKLSIYDYSSGAISFLTWANVTGISHDALAALHSAAFNTTLTPPGPINSILQGYLTNYTNQVPQLEIIFGDGYTGTKGYPLNATPPIQTFTLSAAIMHPFSRGSIHIRSNSSSDAPLINNNYLSHPYDIKALIEGVKFLRRLASAQPMSDVWTTEFDPGFDAIPRNATDDVWEAYVRRSAGTVYHPVGTCAMLPKEQGGVVNSQLQIYGTGGLRVIDASVIPVLLSGHIQTAVYGIAEAGAQIMIDKWFPQFG